MKVRVLHVGGERWVVEDPTGARWAFDPTKPYTGLGLAAGRDYVPPFDVVDVDEADLVAER